MKKYVEITLLPDAEIPIYFLWAKLYQQLHLAFVESADDEGRIKVGVSFPKYCAEKRWLGDKLRMFAESESQLEALNLGKWLARINDYVHIRGVKNVPDNVDGYALFKRLNDKSNKEKLARRRAKRLGVSLDEALNYFYQNEDREQPQKEVVGYPFISMTSLSSGNKFPVTIVREKVDSLVFADGFNTYGFSIDRTNSNRNSSVPMFR